MQHLLNMAIEKNLSNQILFFVWSAKKQLVKYYHEILCPFYYYALMLDKLLLPLIGLTGNSTCSNRSFGSLKGEDFFPVTSYTQHYL